MLEIEIPKGIEVKLEGNDLTIKGKLGSTVKRLNLKYTPLEIANGKITIKDVSNKKVLKQATLIHAALATEIKNAFNGVENGVQKRLQVVFAHFPISFEVKGKIVLIKNIFGEKTPRKSKIMGDTKLEVKGQEVLVKGVDPYDVSQTIANIKRTCAMPNFDSRVFQDGVYIAKEE